MKQNIVEHLCELSLTDLSACCYEFQMLSRCWCNVYCLHAVRPLGMEQSAEGRSSCDRFQSCFFKYPCYARCTSHPGPDL